MQNYNHKSMGQEHTQETRNAIANALELHLSWTNPSMG